MLIMLLLLLLLSEHLYSMLSLCNKQLHTSSCDPIWQTTSHSHEMGCQEELHRPLPLPPYAKNAKYYKVILAEKSRESPCLQAPWFTGSEISVLRRTC